MSRRVAFVIPLFLLCAVLWAAPALARAGLPDVTDLAESAGKAVVNINTVKVVQGSNPMEKFGQFRRGLPGTPFDDFFRDFDKFFGGQGGGKRKQRSLGSGFVISADGYIVTNHHVIEGADEIGVTLQGESEPVEAKLVGSDSETDLALLKIEAKKPLPVLEFGDSDSMRVGQWVMAIGNPFGLDHTVTVGIVSAKGRVIGAGPFDNFIQTDASINPGNSGGPLLDMDGKVIGINSAIVASGQGIGFAVPSNMARTVIGQLKEHKKVSRGWLGVSIQNVDENTAKGLGLEGAKGVLVANAMAGDPAAKAGLETGDVILEVDGTAVNSTQELLNKIASHSPGDSVKLTVWRKGRTNSYSVKLGERNADKLASAGEEQSQGAETALGLSMRPINADEARALGMDNAKGLIVLQVKPDSPAQEADVRAGDVILEANQKEVNTVAAFKSVLDGDAKKKGVVMLLLQRKGQNVFRTIPLPK